MMRTVASLAVLSALVIGTPVRAANTGDRCAALNYMFAKARSNFPELAREDFSPGHCSLGRQQFKCRWGFPADRFASAQDQASRLTDCTAAASGAEPVKGKGGEMAYRLDPATSVFIRGPQMDSGEWAITLRIVSSDDWN
jgi:hypothetical protein